MKPTIETAILKQFEQYLAGKGHSPKTRASIKKAVLQLEKWIPRQDIREISSVIYSDLLLYIKHCTSAGNARKTIALKLLFLRHFYDFLLKEGQVSENPVAGIMIQGVKRHMLHNILTGEELDRLYQDYQCPGVIGQRNKVILGLLLYQGLRSEEVEVLRVQDIFLREGKIVVPRGRRTNERTLALKPVQVVELMEYIHSTRPIILQQTGKTTDQLILSTGSSPNLQNTLQYLIGQLRTQDTRITSLKQIRASVITGWVKSHNLRLAQYMAGHRYVSSTEKYKVNDLEGLIEDIGKYHQL